MPTEVKQELVISDFRQNYEPERAAPVRHWLADHAVGREVLASQLRVLRKDLKVPVVIGSDQSLDAELSAIVPSLGLGGLTKPVSAWEDIKTSWKLMFRLASIEWSELKSVVASVGQKQPTP